MLLSHTSVSRSRFVLYASMVFFLLVLFSCPVIPIGLRDLFSVAS